MADEQTEERVVPLQELIKERKARQAAEIAAAEASEKLNTISSETEKYKQYISEADKRLSVLDEISKQHESLSQAHNELTARFDRELQLADLGVHDREAREFALFKFQKSGESDFNAWVSAQKEAGSAWIAGSQKQTLPSGVARTTQPKAPDESAALANMSIEEKTAYWRKKFPQFAVHRK